MGFIESFMVVEIVILGKDSVLLFVLYAVVFFVSLVVRIVINNKSILVCGVANIACVGRMTL